MNKQIHEIYNYIKKKGEKRRRRRKTLGYVAPTQFYYTNNILDIDITHLIVDDTSSCLLLPLPASRAEHSIAILVEDRTTRTKNREHRMWCMNRGRGGLRGGRLV